MVLFAAQPIGVSLGAIAFYAAVGYPMMKLGHRIGKDLRAWSVILTIVLAAILCGAGGLLLLGAFLLAAAEGEQNAWAGWILFTIAIAPWVAAGASNGRGGP